MPVPSTMSDLSTTAGSNSPAGTEAIGNSLDNYLRATQAILRSTYALSSATIAAASTTAIATSDAESVQVTGSATITSLGTGFNGCLREVRFAGACTLTHSASIVLPGAANITTAAGDVLTFRCTASGTWLLVGAGKAQLGYTAANKAGESFTGGINFGSVIAASATDLTGHVSIFSTTYGFSVTTNSFNHVASITGAHNWYSGSTNTMTLSTAGALSVVSTLTTGGDITMAGQLVGFRGVPLTTSGATTFVLADAGKGYLANAAGVTFTVPPNSSVAYPVGTILVAATGGGGSATVAPGAGVSLRLAGTGTTGSRTLGQNAYATIYKTGTDVWLVSGPGVT